MTNASRAALAQLAKEEAQDRARAANLELDNAIELAVAVHQGQVDKQGQPYILHPLRVMLAVPSTERVAAVLHDVIEDGEIAGPDELESHGISRDNALLVFDLSRRHDGEQKEGYEGYIRRVAQGPRARAIKIADIRDNVGRIGQLADTDPNEAARLLRRYTQALAILSEGIL